MFDSIGTHSQTPGRGPSRTVLIGLVILLFVYALVGQGSRSLWHPDEGRYTCVALNMLKSGDWLHPDLNDEKPHFTKPPLTYWAIALSIRAFGREEWVARLPSALAFVGAVLLIAALGRRFVPRRPWLPALVYATTPLAYSACNLVTTDTLLAFWETLALWGFVEWWHREGEAHRYRWLLLMWGAFGLAFMTKGPPGILPLLPIVAFVGMRGGRKAALGLFSIAGLILFAVVGSTWYLVVIARNPELLSYFVGDEVYGRIVSGEHHRNPQWYGAFVVYIPTLILGGLPWTVALLRRLRGPSRLRWRSVNPFDREQEAGRQFLLLWLLLPLAVLFLARSRLPLYLVPSFAPLSLLLARLLGDFDPLAKRWRWAVVAWVLVLVGLRIGAGYYKHEDATRLFAESIVAQIGKSPAEVVFVDEAPDFGLTFYLDAEVERVNFKSGRGVETLDEELADPEPGILFVVQKRDEDDILRVPVPGGGEWRRVGHYGKSLFYAIPGIGEKRGE